MRSHPKLKNSDFLESDDAPYEVQMSLDLLLEPSYNLSMPEPQHEEISENMQPQSQQPLPYTLDFQQIEKYLEMRSKPYEEETREDKVSRYRRKKRTRVWGKKVRFQARQHIANQRVRVRGRFVPKNYASTITNLQLEREQIKTIFTAESPHLPHPHYAG